MCFPTCWYESFNLFEKKKEKKNNTSKLGICSASLQRKWLVHEQFDPKMEQQSDYWKKNLFPTCSRQASEQEARNPNRKQLYKLPRKRVRKC